MVNVFPELLNYSMFAPMLLRMVVGVFFLYITWQVLFRRRISFRAYFEAREYPAAKSVAAILGFVSFLLGLFLIAGFFTQIAATAAIYICLMMLFIEDREEKILPFTTMMYVIIMIICLTLLVTGAGAFAVDLPL